VSVWNQDRLGGGTGIRHALGLWHPTKKLASASLMPGTRERRKLHGKTLFLYVFDFPNVAAGVTANDRISVLSDFLLTQMTCSVTPNQSAGFPLNPFQISLFDTVNRRRYMDFPIFGSSFAGLPATYGGLGVGSIVPAFTAMPFFERKITKIPRGAGLLMKVQNSTGLVTATFQVVLGGYIE
jgi:hypothetical protein